MAYSSLSAPIAGTPITVAYQVLVNDDIAWLRGLVPDPAAANLALISSGVSGASWMQVPGAAIATGGITNTQLAAGAALANLTYTPVNKNGDTMVGQLIAKKSGVPFNVGLYLAANIQVQDDAGGYPAVGFYRFGVEASALCFNTGDFYNVTGAGARKIWDDGNDGILSALDAGLLGGQAPAYYATAASVTSEASTRASADSAEATARAAADAAIAACPVGLVAYFNTSSPPTGWAEIVGARDRVLIGANATYASSSTGGATTHNHTTDINHDHAAVLTNDNTAGFSNLNFDHGGSETAASRTHNHGTVDIPALGATSATASTVSHIPPYLAYTCIVKT